MHRGATRRAGEKGTATKGEVSVGGRRLWGRCSPVAGLCNINVSQFELTWESGY